MAGSPRERALIMSGGPSTSTTRSDGSAARVGNQAEPGAARCEHLRRTVVSGCVAQHAAQPAVLVADRDQHPAALPSHTPAPKASRATTHAGAHRAARAVARADAQAERSPPQAAAHPSPGSAERPGHYDWGEGASSRARPSRRQPSAQTRGASPGRARALRHTRHPWRRTPSSATRRSRYSPSKTGRGPRARARPDRRSTALVPRAAPSRAARSRVTSRSRAHRLRAGCCSRRPHPVEVRVLGGAADIDARDRLAPRPLPGTRAPAHDRPPRAHTSARRSRVQLARPRRRVARRRVARRRPRPPRQRRAPGARS